MKNIVTQAKIFYDRINSSKRRNLFVTGFIVLTLPLLIYTLLQVQNLVQHANPNGAVSLIVDGQQIDSGGTVTKTFVKLKVAQPDGWQIAAVPSQKQYSLVEQVHAQEAPCPKAGDPGTTSTYGTTTYDRCVDNAGGRSDANTLCAGQSATQFRCYFSGNSFCISGSDENDFNYYCPSKPAAPTATTAPVATLAPCPKAGDPGTTSTYGTTTYDTCVDDKGGVNDATSHSLCTDPASTKFRCFYSKNPTYCLSGATSADLNYFCPAKSAAPSATPISTRAPSQVPSSPTPNRAVVNPSPTPVIPQLQKIIIENIDEGTQGSPREEFDKGNEGRAVIAQLLAGTFDWQLNPYAADTNRKVRVTFVDSTGQNRVAIDTTVTLKASVKILNADNSVPRNNIVNGANVKLVINSGALFSQAGKSHQLVETAYAQIGSCAPEKTLCFPGGSSRSICCAAGEGCELNNGVVSCVAPTATPQPPTATSVPQPKNCPASSVVSEGTPGTTFYWCETGGKCGSLVTARLFECKSSGDWRERSNVTTYCVEASQCENGAPQPTTPPVQPTQQPSSGRAPGAGAPAPVNGGYSACPQQGDTCSYSEANGQCFSGKGASGFNASGCQYSCGPIACEGGSTNTPLPPVEAPVDTGGGEQPGASNQPKIIIRNADLGSGGSEERELPLGDVSIDDWVLHTAGANSLRTVQAIFKNANGDTVGVVNAFVSLGH